MNTYVFITTAVVISFMAKPTFMDGMSNLIEYIILQCKMLFVQLQLEIFRLRLLCSIHYLKIAGTWKYRHLEREIKRQIENGEL